MRFRSYLYHVLLWNAKRLCGIQRTASCGLEELPCRTYVPPVEWQQSLDDSQRARLNIVLQELEVLARIYTYIPEKIAIKEWQELIKMDSVRERFQHLNFIRMKERLKAKDLNDKMSKKRGDSVKEQTDIALPLCSTSAEDQEEKQEEKKLSEEVDDIEEADSENPYKLSCRRTWNKQVQEGFWDSTPGVA
uniref:Uncharacterized protein n=1 Tax=Ditylenchus dipsaci TaxID=166011 RepID=A0A915DWG0_9BILA